MKQYIEGIEYELNTGYDFEVWEPVVQVTEGITISATQAEPLDADILIRNDTLGVKIVDQTMGVRLIHTGLGVR